MGMSIPKYLREISDVINTSKNVEIAKIKCKCGCNRFIAYKYTTLVKPDIKHVSNEIIRENNELYLIKRSFWGKIIKKIKYSDTFYEKPRNVVKVKCQKCNSEYILFDNFKHGYDSINANFSNVILSDISAGFKEVYHQSLEVFVKIHQDISYDLFQEEFKKKDFEVYLNSFDNIEIYGITSNSRKINICMEETS